MSTKRSIVISASEDRLQKLIEERLPPGAEKAYRVVYKL